MQKDKAEIVINSKSEIIIIEDQQLIVKGITKRSRLTEFRENVFPILDHDSFLDFISVNKIAKPVCIVDLNLGTGRETDGVPFISFIRKKTPEALIIVFTGNSDAEKICREAGADHFFLKSAQKGVFDEIYEIVDDFLNQDSTISYKAEVVQVNEQDGWVELECYYKDQTVLKQYPIKPIEAAVRELVVDCSLVVTIRQIGPEIRISFKEEKTKGAGFGELEKYKDLLKSSIWSAKEDK